MNINRYADMHVLETWYAQITAEELLEQFEKDQEFHPTFESCGKGCAQYIRSHVQQVDSRRERSSENVDQPPLLFHVHESDAELQSQLERRVDD